VPFYEYRCPENHLTTRVKSIKIADDELNADTCATCGDPAELAVSKPGRPILVGQGFHENDYQHGKLGS
jgi:hypothetical protein